MDNNQTTEIKNKIKHRIIRFHSIVKWIICSALIGFVVGTVATLFGIALNAIIEFRSTHQETIFLLPVAGLIIIFIYNLCFKNGDKGTNLVISAINSDSEVPALMAPLIFISTLITHFVGGSAGREGAALQIGGSLANFIGNIFGFNETDKKTMIMCGMSAAFSALFGTPMAAAIFALEVISIGIMHYASLVPCVIASLVAHSIAEHFKLQSLAFPLTHIPAFSLKNAIIISIFAILCGILSTIFCFMLHRFSDVFAKLVKNSYLRVIIGGSCVLILTLLVGSDTYNSTGTNIITNCFNDNAVPFFAFLLKMIFTTITLSCGYKGGEIVPTLFIGATFGATFGHLIHFNQPLLAAVGMGSLFCGVTNCPITSLLICFELFGYDAMPYYLLAIAFSYWLSGYHGLYISQKIVYSKYKNNYINKNVH